MKKSSAGRGKNAYGTASNCAFMIRQAWKDGKSVLWIVLGLAACGVGGNLLELFVVPAVLEMVERGVSPGEFVRMILRFALGLVFVHALRRYLEQNAFFGRSWVRLNLTKAAHDQFCRTSYPHIEDPAYLKLADKAQSCLCDNHKAAQAVWDTLRDLLATAISFVLYLLLLAPVGPGIALLTAVLAAVSYFAGEHIRSWRYRRREEEAELAHKILYIWARGRDFKLAKDVRIFGLAPWLTELCDKYNRLYLDFERKSEWICLWADGLDVLLTLLRNGAAYGWLISRVAAGELSPAEFVLYFNAVSGFTQWVAGILSALGTLHRQSMDISSLREYLDIPELFQFEEGKPLPVKRGHAYTLELRDVSFRYPGADKDTLSHINLTIRPGEKLAVVGNNGVGKTTLIKLLCGFYDPTGGQVLLDGEDIRQFNRRDYYKHFSAVFQQFSPLAGSVAENVAQSIDHIDKARVWDCLERAGLAQKIRELPRQEDTHLSRRVYLDGVELSGGQTQRLLLARALYKDAPIVVLDEPTAALDPIAESGLYNKYHEMTRHCTSVYISHRLASTRFCDRVLLIENGGIAEEGTHEELLARGGRYARLFDIQSKYYQEEVPANG